MIYVYECKKCGYGLEVVKSYKDIDRIEVCDNCDLSMSRVIQPVMFDIQYVHDKAQWDDGLGMWIRNKSELRGELKARGLVEAGGEDIEKYCTDAKRAKEIQDDKEWDAL